MYGIIHDGAFSLHPPRLVDSENLDTLADAFKEAAILIRDGHEELEIVECREIPGIGPVDAERGSIIISAHNWSDVDET